MRRLLLVVVTMMVVLWGPSAGATTTTLPQLPDGCTGTALSKPGCGTEPQSSGDRGGVAQLVLFAVVITGMATVLVVVVRGSNRRTAP